MGYIDSLTGDKILGSHWYLNMARESV